MIIKVRNDEIDRVMASLKETVNEHCDPISELDMLIDYWDYGLKKRDFESNEALSSELSEVYSLKTDCMDFSAILRHT